jgi:hypothetical protein
LADVRHKAEETLAKVAGGMDFSVWISWVAMKSGLKRLAPAPGQTLPELLTGMALLARSPAMRTYYEILRRESGFLKNRDFNRDCSLWA